MQGTVWLAPATLLRGLLLCLLGLALGLAACPAFAADPYRLNVSDTIRVRVVQWEPAEATLEEWTAIGGEYLIGPNGTISFPFVGETESADKTTEELASTLGNSLQHTLGLVSVPSVSVEVVKFGPVYVTGDVQSPGEFPYAPGLTVIKVVALAGGERRSVSVNPRIDRDLIDTKGSLDVLRGQYERLLAQRARIDAELGTAAKVAVPPELADDKQGPAMVAIEQAILDTNARQAKSSLDAIASQKLLLTREIEALGQKRTNAEQQLALAQEQLDSVKSLVDEGLAVTSRVAQLQANVADISGRMLDIDTAVLTAKQGLGNADREGAQIGLKRASDLAVERQQVEGQIAEAAMKMATEQGLMREAIQFGARAADEENLEPIYSYSITRGSEEIAAERTTEVRPGDVINARLSY